MALNGTGEQVALDCDFSYDSEDQLLVSLFWSLSHFVTFRQVFFLTHTLLCKTYTVTGQASAR